MNSLKYARMVHISEMQKWFNTRESINITQYVNRSKQKNSILLIDAKKVLTQFSTHLWLKKLKMD